MRRRSRALEGEQPVPGAEVVGLGGGRSPAGRLADAELSLPAPAALQVVRFEIEGEEYALLSFPVPEPELPEELTAAEREVVRGVVRGESNGEIARQRGVSANTVANQLRSVYFKLGVGNRRELVSRCLRTPAGLRGAQ